jgi:hypothetical protein
MLCGIEKCAAGKEKLESALEQEAKFAIGISPIATLGA